MKRILIGRQVEGKISWKPRLFLAIGCLFVNVGTYSVMVVLPDWMVRELSIWGIDAVGD